MADIDSPGAGTAHFVLQGKGGVGKSLVASILAQYFASRGAPPVCIDTDPINQTFYSYRALNAVHLPVRTRDSSRVDERKFDPLIRQIISGQGPFVIDNGASTFIALSGYLLESRSMELLQEAGRQAFIHVIITGGQALLETLEGFRALAQAAISQNIVVWLNEFFGYVEHEDKTFVDMRAFRDHADKVRGIVRIQKRNPDTFGADMLEMATRKLTFAEVLESPQWELVARQRIRIIQRDLYEQIEQLGF